MEIKTHKSLPYFFKLAVHVEPHLFLSILALYFILYRTEHKFIVSLLDGGSNLKQFLPVLVQCNLWRFRVMHQFAPPIQYR